MTSQVQPTSKEIILTWKNKHLLKVSQCEGGVKLDNFFLHALYTQDMIWILQWLRHLYHTFLKDFIHHLGLDLTGKLVTIDGHIFNLST